MKNGVMVSEKIFKIELPYGSEILLLGMSSKKSKARSWRDFAYHVYGSIIYNSQKMEATQMFIDRWINK